MKEAGEHPTKKMSESDIVNAVRKEFPDGVTIGGLAPRRIFARADRFVFYKLCQFLKDQLSF
ncbi:MAG: hypothetical protein QW083_04530, partial [Methanomassiliicoccales archaeon]